MCGVWEHVLHVNLYLLIYIGGKSVRMRHTQQSPLVECVVTVAMVNSTVGFLESGVGGPESKHA